ncbi:MAG TPA: hypothetical protein VIS48_15210 [Candidatus Kryptonia bacterium]
MIRKKTVCALTDQRVLILTGFGGQSLKALNLKSLPEMSLDLYGDHRGTITFGVNPGMPYINRPLWGMSRINLFALERIENANEVYNMVQSAQNKVAK